MGKKASPDFENNVSLKINDIDIELNEFADEIIKETSIVKYQYKIIYTFET